MRFILASARKDLLRLLREPVTLLLWIGIPVFVGLLLTAIFGREPATPRGLLLVADEDQSFVSRLVSGAFSQGELGRMFQVEQVEQVAGRRRIARGEASALLVIPTGFAAAVLSNQRAELKVVKNPSQRILPQMVEEIASVLADGAFYVNAIAGDQLRVFASPPPGGAATYPDQTVMGISAAINRLVRSVEKYINPPVIKLDSVTAEPAQPGVNVAALFFPSMFAMAVLFFAQGLSGDFWTERNGHTLRRLASTAAPLWQMVAGKLTALAAVLAAAGLAGLACARWLLGLAVARPLLMILWVVGIGTAFYLSLSLLQMLASSDRAGNMLVSFIFFPLGMLGGVFFPFEMMPAWMAAVARRSPVGWALAELRALISGPNDAARTVLSFAVLAAVCAILFALTLFRLKRGFAR